MISLFSYQYQERSSKSLQKDDDYLEEKICQFKKSKSGYVSTLTRVINKPPDYINLNSDINVIKRYKTKLQNAIKSMTLRLSYMKA